jgi:hypothetical protein
MPPRCPRGRTITARAAQRGRPLQITSQKNSAIDRVTL